ncbi:hypothetical protein ACFWQL_01970 [Amycolatopsis thermoflava]|uniref:hypothetical protein n=1 Tax=Amycolatopsis thermoflava TaxID=84480 RepID=UPI0036461986
MGGRRVVLAIVGVVDQSAKWSARRHADQQWRQLPGRRRDRRLVPRPVRRRAPRRPRRRGLGLAVIAIAAGTALLAVAAGRGLVRLRPAPGGAARLLAGAVGLGAAQDTGVTSAALTPAVGR